MKYIQYPYTELGNAKRWTNLFSGHFKKVPELDAWLYWDGVRWVTDLHGNVIQKTIDAFLDTFIEERRKIEAEIAYISEMLHIANLQGDENELQDSSKQKIYLEKLNAILEANIKWHHTCQSKAKIESCLSLASSMGASMSYTEFDCKGKYLGVSNGVINLVTGQFVQNDPNYLIIKSAAADYIPDATCPNWIDFLNKIFENNTDKISFIQRVAGEALLGERCKTKLIMLTGDGANGKSTFVDCLLMLLGNYAVTTSPDAITSGNKSNDYYLASMKGARLAILNESRVNAKLDNNMVKQLVDSGKVSARQIYGHPFEFQPVATPILTTNNPPIISSEYAINRRLLCVNFTYQIPEQERDPNFIKNMLAPELSGILNWALEGCKQYLQQGLNPPESILQSTREYIFEHDRVLKFIREEYDVDPHSKVNAKEVYSDYIKWCAKYDHEAFSGKQLNHELRGMGHSVRISTGNVNYVFGIAKKLATADNVLMLEGRKSNTSALLESLQY